MFDCAAGYDNLTSLGLRGHAICGVHGCAKNVVLLLNDRTVVTTDANRYSDAVFLLGVGRNPCLHHHGRAHRFLNRWKCGHNLITNRLDHGAVVLVGCVFHNVQAQGDRLAGFGIAKLVVQLRAADNVSKHNRDFKIFCHIEPVTT